MTRLFGSARNHRRRAVAVLALGCAVLLGADMDPAGKQKEAAQANWSKALDQERRTEHESATFLLYGTGDIPKGQLRDLAELLEKQAEQAAKALKMDGKDKLWTGKLTVYVFGQRKQLVAFVKSIEKRRPDDDDLGSFRVDGDAPHIAVCDPPTKKSPSRSQQAMEQHAAALLTKHAGCPMPEWLTAGFAQATAWRAGARNAREARQQARQIHAKNKCMARDIWNSGLNADDAAPLRGALVEFLAYGPRSSSFVEFIKAFKPNGDRTPGMNEVLQAIQMTPDELEQEWKDWMRNGMK